MVEKLNEVNPKEVLKVIDAYIKTLNSSKKNVVVPKVLLYLSNGQVISGTISKFESDKNLLALCDNNGSDSILTFVRYENISAISLINAELCSEFLTNLSATK